ncbi:hypothetical protein HK101_002587 [Irineochytrium annulatum]|nr:hypothetical protein HK101_002587 [Irineochytrium annulatum]
MRAVHDHGLTEGAAEIFSEVAKLEMTIFDYYRRDRVKYLTFFGQKGYENARDAVILNMTQAIGLQPPVAKGTKSAQLKDLGVLPKSMEGP